MARRKTFPWIIAVIVLLAIVVVGKLKWSDRLSDHVD
jgi:hypothetical protein